MVVLLQKKISKCSEEISTCKKGMPTGHAFTWITKIFDCVDVVDAGGFGRAKEVAEGRLWPCEKAATINLGRTDEGGLGAFGHANEALEAEIAHDQRTDDDAQDAEDQRHMCDVWGQDCAQSLVHVQQRVDQHQLLDDGCGAEVVPRKENRTGENQRHQETGEHSGDLAGLDDRADEEPQGGGADGSQNQDEDQHGDALGGHCDV